MYSNAFRNRRSRQNNSNLKPTINNRIITSPYTQYKKLISMRGHIAPIYTAMFDRKDERLVTGSDDNLIKVWDVKTGWLLRTLRGHQAAPRGKDVKEKM